MRSRLFDTGAHSLLPISDFANILCRQINPIDTTPQISVRLCGWFLVSSGTHLPMPSGTRRQTVHSQRTSIKMNCGPILRVALQCKRRLAHARSIPMHPPDQSHTSLLTGASQTAQGSAAKKVPRRGHQCWFLSCVVHSFGSMFCPQCKAEYRPGFTRCSDCEVDLVEHLAESNDSTVSSSGATKRVWLCDDQESCVDVCSGLKAAGIPFRVAQRRKQVFWRVDEHYEVWVPAAFYDRAKIIAEKGCFDFSDSDEDQRIMELPDADTSAVKREVRDWGWRPEDATVEVWSGGTELKGVAWMVEASLHEHGIRTHADVTQEGFQRIFVRPEDEHEAREIMHEIKNGTPPT